MSKRRLSLAWAISVAIALSGGAVTSYALLMAGISPPIAAFVGSFIGAWALAVATFASRT